MVLLWQAVPLRHEEVDEEGKGCDPHERLDLGGLALKERDDHVGDKARPMPAEME